MRALRKLDEGASLTLCEVPEPAPGPHQVVLDVAACGICGTDLHILQGEYRARLPVTLGHEAAGTLAALGEGVRDWHLGQRVVAETYFSVCGRCDYCLAGRPNLCPERASIGSMRDGAFADKLLVPARNLHALPPTLGFPEAALVEPLACVVRGLTELAVLRAGDLALVTGPGAIGLLALQVARASGARVVMVGTPADRGRLERAKELGAERILEASGEPQEDAGRARELLGAAPDVVIECSGSAAAGRLLLDCVRPAGRFIQVGLYGRPVQLDFDRVCYKELHVTGSFATTPSSWRRALELAGSGRVSLRGVVGASYPLEDWQAAFAAATAGTPGRVLLLP
ncbi:MAG TPA: zinc-binding dehydrogenase [Trueperaceae bacterium]